MTLTVERLFCRTGLCKAVLGKTAAKECIHTIRTQRPLMKRYWWGPTQCSGLPTLNGVQMRWTGWFAQLGAHCLQTRADAAALPELYLLLTWKMQNTILIEIKKKGKGQNSGTVICLTLLWRHLGHISVYFKMQKQNTACTSSKENQPGSRGKAVLQPWRLGLGLPDRLRIDFAADLTSNTWQSMNFHGIAAQKMSRKWFKAKSGRQLFAGIAFWQHCLVNPAKGLNMSEKKRQSPGSKVQFCAVPFARHTWSQLLLE